MAASDRDEIVAGLRKEENRVSAAVQQTREKAKALSKELKGIRSALAALTGQSNLTTKKKAKKEARPASTNDAVKQRTENRKKQAQSEPS